MRIGRQCLSLERGKQRFMCIITASHSCGRPAPSRGHWFSVRFSSTRTKSAKQIMKQSEWARYLLTTASRTCVSSAPVCPHHPSLQSVTTHPTLCFKLTSRLTTCTCYRSRINWRKKILCRFYVVSTRILNFRSVDVTRMASHVTHRLQTPACDGLSLLHR